MDHIAEVFKAFIDSGETIMDTVILGAISDGEIIFGTYFGGPGEDTTRYDDLIDDFIEELEDILERQE